MAIRFDAAPLSKIKRTPNGGIQVEARLTRTGIFTYKNPDGTERREYRPDEEVFRKDSLATFSGVPLTIGHPGLVNTQNWKEVSVGHVGENVAKDGQFASGTVYVQDAKACADIESGKLRELSVGYQIDIDPTPGEFQGQRYDMVQRNIRANHVAILPRGAGRAGREVELRLDSNGNESTDYTGNDMPGKNDKSSDKDPSVVINTPDMTIRVDGQAQIDKLQAKVEMLETELAVYKDPKRLDALVDARFELRDAARRVLGEDFKMDGLSDREIKEAVIKSRKKDFRADGKSEDWVQAAYEMALDFSPAPTSPGLGKLRTDANSAPSGEDPIEVARRKNETDNLNRWKSPLSTMNKAS